MDAKYVPHDPQGLGYPFHQGQVRVKFVAGLVDGAKGCTRQLQLATGLEGNAGALLLQGDEVGTLENASPAVDLGDRLEEGPDASRGVVGHRTVVVGGETDLLVLGADPKLLGGLLPAAKHLDQIFGRPDPGIRFACRAQTHEPVPSERSS